VMADWQVAVAQPDRLGESPFWHPVERLLYWIDIPAMQLRRCDVMNRGAVESWSMPSEPGCIAPAQSGGLVIALRDGFYRAHEWKGTLALIVRAEHDPRTTRFNDGKADPLGRMWAGTMYEPKDAPNAKLYSLDCRPGNGQGGKPLLETKVEGALTANGLAWSPDRRTIYWTDTPAHTIRAWDWDAESNVMSNERVFKQFPGKPDGWKPGDAGYGGRPDGASVDAEGNYWCAMYEGGRVLQISRRGDVLQDIKVPAMCPTMPCFGGDDLKTLFVTTARDKRPEKELGEFPDSGCVFAMNGEVPGLASASFGD
jgi:sugar lactone lactonase YvrE